MELKLTNGKMSSLYIAERTGKKHSHVLRDIKKMITDLDDPKLDHINHQEINDNRGYVSEILLSEKYSLLLATGYSVKLRLLLIEDWQKAKAQAVEIHTPQTFAQALRLAAEQAEALELKEAQIQGLEQALDTSEQWISIIRAAKQSGVRETVFSWRVLKSFSIENGIEIKTAPCPRFGTKKLYHVSVFARCYPQIFKAA